MTSNSVESPTFRPDEVGLEARDEPLLAQDERHPVRGAAVEGDAVARPGEADDGVVAFLRAAVLDGRQGRVLVEQFLDDLVDAGVVRGLDLRPEVEVLVVAELHLRADLDGRLEDEGLALLGLDDLHVRVGQGHDVLLDERVAVGRFGQVLDRVVEDRAGAQGSLQDRPRGLAGTEARDARPAGQVADRLGQLLVQAVGWELDLEHDGTVGSGGGGDLHRPRSIGRRHRGGRSRPDGHAPGRWLVGERGVEPPRRFRGTGS